MRDKEQLRIQDSGEGILHPEHLDKQVPFVAGCGVIQLRFTGQFIGIRYSTP